MALVGNGSVLLKSPGRFVGGVHPGGARAAAGDGSSSSLRARFFGGMSATASIPSGYPSDGWAPPLTGGAIKAVGTLDGDLAASAAIAGGRNGATSVSASVDLSALGQLVAGLAAALSASLDASGTIAGAAAGSATLNAGTATLSATGSAIADLVAALSAGSVTLSAEPTGLGHMAATITSYTELSVEGLVAALWGAIAVEHATPGTMGELLNAAGSGGMASEFQTILRELHRLAGLDADRPLVVTSTTRTAGAEIEQTIAEAAGTITVTRT